MHIPHKLPFDNLIILGPTATGKTKLAVQLAKHLNGEIISADSRQVYRGMDIGTGKDLKDYKIDETEIPYHLIDILNPNEEYNVSQFQNDANRILSEIKSKKKLPIVCGGTGFYIKALLMNFNIPKTKPDKFLRQKLEKFSLDELIIELENISTTNSKFNLIDTKRRAIRAIEIELDKKNKLNSDLLNQTFSINNFLVLGVLYDREKIREKITSRLSSRLKNGMIEEVESLIKLGITKNRLESLGLEYRFISRYLDGAITNSEMFTLLNTAIHQFAKKQMTFFRNMEKNGININWVSKGNLDLALNIILKS